MSSSVFFKFKSQKEPSRVTFDGTGISVFELKREIIQINRLGDGSDFDLAIYNQDSNEEYDDDTTIIPRSTSIVARRLPPTKPGKGTAQRYVSGKMPTNALPNAGRRERNFGHGSQAQKPAEMPVQVQAPVFTGAESEEDRIAAMFATSSEQWNKTQEQLAAATPVYRGGGGAGGGGFKKNSAPVPAHPPPTGYVCYRCGEKGHWIQQCPTNADPTFDGRPRVKRTTGIPRSFLKTVEKPVPQASDDGLSDAKNPTSIMVNAEGEYVVAQPDQASWENYQKKAGTAKTEAPTGSKELQDLGIECSMCKKLMKDATRTPCCGNVYCEDCIQNALLESDFVCPTCDAKEILLGALLEDKETRDKVAAYNTAKEKEKTGGDNEKPTSTSAATSNGDVVVAASNVRAASNSPSNSAGTPTTNPSTASSQVSKKRAATDDLGPEIPRGPAAMRNLPQQQHHQQNHHYQNNMYAQQNAYNNPYNNNNNYNNFNPYAAMGMNMNMMGPMGYFNPAMYYPQMDMSQQQHMPQQHHHQQYPQNNFQQQQQHQSHHHHQQQHQQQFRPPVQSQPQQQVQQQQPQVPAANGFQGAAAPFMNQQKTVFSEPFPSEEDSPYMRKPVNPHRHVRPKRIRPSDFKAVGGEMM